jgi:hypothetical protein
MNWNEIFEYRNGELFWKIRPSNKKLQNKKVGCFSHGYIRLGYKKKLYYAHRVIWEMHHGVIPKNMLLDHIDGNGLNNKIKNLRLVNHNGNKRNLPINCRNTSGFTGVYWNKEKKAWDARMNFKKPINLGRFKTKEKAIEARKKAETEYGFSDTHGKRQKRVVEKQYKTPHN